MRLRIILITLALAISAGAAAVATASTNVSPIAERFTLSGATIRGVDRPLRVTAVGPIAGSGTVQDKDGAARHDTLVFHLATGTVALSADEKSIAAHPDFHTCTAKIVAPGSFTITGGTGAFHAATGNGTFTRHTSAPLRGASEPGRNNGARLCSRTLSAVGTGPRALEEVRAGTSNGRNAACADNRGS